MKKSELVNEIISRLEKVYPDALCSLTYEQPHELMIAGRLSAQCTDARVNIVTKELFALRGFAGGIKEIYSGLIGITHELSNIFVATCLCKPHSAKGYARNQ